jgi:hypothetical protein
MAAEPQAGPPQTPHPTGQTGTLGLLVRRIDRTQYPGGEIEHPAKKLEIIVKYSSVFEYLQFSEEILNYD